MAETEIKLINGKTLADTFARAEIEELKDKVPDSGGNADYVGVEPAEDDIPKIFFGGALQQTNDEAVVPFRYISKTEDFSGYAEIKAQGNSSMSYAKKNQTVKMFADEACETKIKKDFKGWGKQNKHCYKANWIDLSHARNVVSARLWADVVKSRANYADLPELLRTSPNQGAVDGFPVKVYADGVYQGRYTLNIPKDKWTFNMDDSLDEHCVLCGENYVSGCFRAAANINESDWTDEIHDTVPDSIKTRWNEVISFVMNSTDEEFKAGLSDYFYVDSLIDYHLFGLQSCGLDAYGKNQIYATHDGQKWIACMYDMDSTWGLYWNGSKFVATDYGRDEYEDMISGREGNLLYMRLEKLFWSEIQARWPELKAGPLSIENIINRFERFTDIAPADLVKEDYASTTGGGKFTGIPSQSTNNIQQIRAFALARQAWVDEYVAALTPEVEVPCEGISLDAEALTFTAEGTQTITATVVPDGCTDNVIWISSSPEIASISVSGYVCAVEAVANGDATITASCGEYSASCSVTVSGIETGGDEEGDSADNGIDYELDGLVDATWYTDTDLNYTTGVNETKQYHHVTEKLSLQDTTYMLNIGDGNTWLTVAMYDESDNYLGRVSFSEGIKSQRLYAKSDCRYVIRVYSTTETHTNATLIPMNKSASAEYVTVDLSAIEWVTSSKSCAEAVLPTDVATLLWNNVDQTNCNVLFGDGLQSYSAIIPDLFVLSASSNTYYVIAPYFSTGEAAQTYFTENNTVLEFNKRYQ